MLVSINHHVLQHLHDMDHQCPCVEACEYAAFQTGHEKQPKTADTTALKTWWFRRTRDASIPRLPTSPHPQPPRHTQRHHVPATLGCHLEGPGRHNGHHITAVCPPPLPPSPLPPPLLLIPSPFPSLTRPSPSPSLSFSSSSFPPPFLLLFTSCSAHLFPSSAQRGFSAKK